MVAIAELDVNGRKSGSRRDRSSERQFGPRGEAEKESQGAERNDARDGAITGTMVTAILPTTTNDDQLRRPTWEFARARMRILSPSSRVIVIVTSCKTIADSRGTRNPL